MLGNTGFASIAGWPISDISKIDHKLHYVESLVESTVKDIESVLELAKIEKPSEISIIISEKWKYEFYSKVKELVEDGIRNTGEISKRVMNSELKRHGQEIMKILPKLIDKLPSQVLSQEIEKEAFEKSVLSLEQTFNCDVSIILAEDSKEAKARNAAPGKPAIVVR
jgi:hypothetical protein